MSQELLKITDLSVEYRTDKETVHAVNHIHFSLNKGETIGLVGETGAGKTTARSSSRAVRCSIWKKKSCTTSAASTSQ